MKQAACPVGDTRPDAKTVPTQPSESDHLWWCAKCGEVAARRQDFAERCCFFGAVRVSLASIVIGSDGGVVHAERA